MRRSLIAVALLSVAACGDSGATSPDMASPDLAPAGPKKLTLLYTNDEHSHLFGFGPELDDFPAPTTAGTGTIVGGAARRKVLLDRERAAARAAGADTLTVSAGDVAMGTLSQAAWAQTAPDYTVLAAMGYDVACLGNHEFDYGPAALATAILAAMHNGGAPQLVASNLHFSSTDPRDDTLAALYGEGTDAKPIKRYHVVTTPSGLKVGFLGILGSDAAYKAPFKAPVTGSGLPSEETDYPKVRTKIYADVQPVVDALRNVEKVDLVVALSHSGVDLATPQNGDDYDIAENVSGIDVIISGHTHTVVKTPIVTTNLTSGKPVIIVQAGCFGQYLGRLPLVETAVGWTFTVADAELLAVDDTTVPDPGFAQTVAHVVDHLEGDKLAGGRSSFLEAALSRITGAPVTDDPTKTGDLYFYPLGKTSFDVLGIEHAVETNVMNLDADAILAAARAASSEPVDLSVVASGIVRANIDKGKTGTISFADAFRTFPLGADPADGSIGYPLAGGYLWLVELKGAFEVGASLGLESNTDFFLDASGVRVTVDTSRKAYDPSNPTDATNGRVTKIEWNSKRDGTETYDDVLFDVTRADPWSDGTHGIASLFHVVTDLYIASFAASQHVMLKDKDGNALADPSQAILKRSDGSEVKEYEAFAGYIKSVSDHNGGMLPSLYDATTPAGHLPRHILCSGPVCGKY